MVNHISISNFAIIKNTEIDFKEGLNIITGETGSGKSIVIEAISLALGSRADSSLVRHGADKAIIQLAAEIDNQEIIITREITSNGKNLCKLNGQLVTLTELNETCKKIADIHGQYDNQSLLNAESHISLVDNFLNDTIHPLKVSFQSDFNSYQEKKIKLTKLKAVESENIRKIDFFRFEKNEIEKANLLINEDAELDERISLLQNSEKIFEGIESAHSLLSNGEANALDNLRSSLKSLQSISEYSKEIQELSEDYADVYYRLEDISIAMRDIKEKIVFSPDELDNAISRLDLIDNLKKKYGNTIEEILSYKDKISEELNQFDNYDDIKANLENEVNEAYNKLKVSAEVLSQARKKSATKLSKYIEQELHQLNFNDAILSIKFTDLNQISSDGKDCVEIYISTNKGEPLKPLIKVASGGEISRIMLAIKNITGTYDKIQTMIFDEIDAGISGITASVVGKKLREISKSHQIICITHLPQIAACGDYNFRIYKESDESNTFTYVESLSKDKKISEIARLLGGENITDTTLKNAEELINNIK